MPQNDTVPQNEWTAALQPLPAILNIECKLSSPLGTQDLLKMEEQTTKPMSKNYKQTTKISLSQDLTKLG